MKKYLTCILVILTVAVLLTACKVNITFSSDKESDSAPEEYRSVVTMYVNDGNLSEESNKITASDLIVSVELINTIKQIVLSDSVMDLVAERIGYSSGKTLPVTVDVKSVDETQVFQIIVIAENAELAVQTANTIAQVAPEKIANIIDGISIKLISTAKEATPLEDETD